MNLHAMKPSTQHIDMFPAAWLERQQRRAQSDVPEVWDMLDQVKDPEVPALSLWDLGVLCDIEKKADGKLIVTITPTYSGCPAMEAMRQDIDKVLHQAGFVECEIKTQLSPAWSTDWMSPQGKEQLRAFGIAPPMPCTHKHDLPAPEGGMACPHCQSENTQLVSEFGSTACKALYKCQDCYEPFDYFKAI